MNEYQLKDILIGAVIVLCVALLKVVSEYRKTRREQRELDEMIAEIDRREHLRAVLYNEAEPRTRRFD
jgi:cell shape-determining protein MreC